MLPRPAQVSFSSRLCSSDDPCHDSLSRGGESGLGVPVPWAGGLRGDPCQGGGGSSGCFRLQCWEGQNEGAWLPPAARLVCSCHLGQQSPRGHTGPKGPSVEPVLARKGLLPAVGSPVSLCKGRGSAGRGDGGRPTVFLRAGASAREVGGLHLLRISEVGCVQRWEAPCHFGLRGPSISSFIPLRPLSWALKSGRRQLRGMHLRP